MKALTISFITAALLGLPFFSNPTVAQGDAEVSKNEVFAVIADQCGYPLDTILHLYGAAAVVKESHKIPICLTFAIMIKETGWLTSDLTAYNNIFGIKADDTDWRGETYCKLHDDYYKGRGWVNNKACFRIYDSFEDSIFDFGEFLSGRRWYSPAFQCGNDQSCWAERLGGAGYSTSPSWASELIELMERFKLKTLDN